MERIDTKNIRAYASCLPDGVFDRVALGEYEAFGESFGGRVAGAIAYSVSDDGGDRSYNLESIFVLPMYRLLGIGENLMSMIPRDGLTFRYTADGERSLLEPFFESLDITVEREDLPVGRMTLEEAYLTLKKDGLEKAKKKGSFFRELSKSDQLLMAKSLYDSMGVKPAPYINDVPASVFHIQNGQVLGYMLMRESIEGQLELDYLYMKPGYSHELLGVMKKGIEAAYENYSPDTVIEMTLSKKKALNLYKELFGSPDHYIPMIYK